MNRGAWWAAVQGVAELDTPDGVTHTHLRALLQPEAPRESHLGISGCRAREQSKAETFHSRQI